MRLNLYNQLGNNLADNVNAVITGTVNGALTLVGDPTQPLEAATKQYVDSVFNNLNASKITGSLVIARMPAFTGDAVSGAGTASFTLSNTGVTAGEYAKVTVGTKGRVTAGSQLTTADIPALDWSKITTGKPTTAAGYGITDGLLYTGGTALGTINITVDPSSNLHAANKRYVDSKSTSVGAGYAVGDVILRPTPVTPDGFLRCNGGELSQTTYATLYAVVGDNYTFPTTPGSGKPWQQQYLINDDQSRDITGWDTGDTVPTGVSTSQVIVTKNRVYLIGVNGTSAVHTAAINANGALGSWTETTSLTGTLAYSQAIVTKNRVYLLGGFNGSSYVATVYTAPINADGTLGTWTAGPSLPGVLGLSQAIVTKNRVYLLGGVIASAGAVSTVYTAQINADGTLATNTDGTGQTWKTGPSLPAVMANAQAVVTKNRVYLLAGRNGSGGVSTVYTAQINADGTLATNTDGSGATWKAVTNLPGIVYGSSAFVTKNRVYLLGGYHNNNYSPVVYTAPIDNNGIIGVWSGGTSLPIALMSSQVIVTKNRIHLLGGVTTGDVVVSTAYSTSIVDGQNSYSLYYDGTHLVTTTGNFRLPDMTLVELDRGYYYIKY